MNKVENLLRKKNIRLLRKKTTTANKLLSFQRIRQNSYNSLNKLV